MNLRPSGYEASGGRFRIISKIRNLQQYQSTTYHKPFAHVYHIYDVSQNLGYSLGYSFLLYPTRERRGGLPRVMAECMGIEPIQSAILPA